MPWTDTGSMWTNGRTSRWGGINHAVQRQPTRPGQFVPAACGQIVELGEVPHVRHGRQPSDCSTCASAVALTETLIERNDARTPN